MKRVKIILSLIILSISLFVYSAPEKFAVIKNNKVINIIIAENSSDIPAMPDCTIIQSDNAKIGQSYTDGVFVPVPVKTEAEIQAEIEAKKLARTVFKASEIIEAIEAVDRANENTALSTKLATVLSSNAAFSIYWSAYSNAIDLKHPVCVQALSSFTENEINTLKLKIGE